MKIFLWLPLYAVALMMPLPFTAAASPFVRGGEDDGADGLDRHLFPLKGPNKSEKKGGKGKGLCGTSPSCSGGKECVSGANRTFSQNLTAPGVIFGNGNADGNFTTSTDQSGCIEIGIRGKLRFATPGGSPAGVFGDKRNGTYGSFSLGVTCPTPIAPPASGAPALCVAQGVACDCPTVQVTTTCKAVNAQCPQPPIPSFCNVLTTPEWSYDWSINVAKNSTSCTKKLKDYCYEVGLDADPSAGTDFTVFDPINPTASKPAWDHAIGNKTSTQVPPVRFVFPGSCTLADGTPQGCYERGLLENNVAQNSWNYEFNNDAGTSLFNFNSQVPGSYIVYFRVLDCSTKNVVAQNFIEFLVGDAPSVGNAVCLPSQKKGGCSGSSSYD